MTTLRMKWFFSVLIFALLSSGCGSAVVVVHFDGLPAGTTSVRLMTTLLVRGQASATPQEDILVEGDLTQPVGLRFSPDNLIEFDVSATALRGDGGSCGGSNQASLLLHFNARNDVILTFPGGSC